MITAYSAATFTPLPGHPVLSVLSPLHPVLSVYLFDTTGIAWRFLVLLKDDA